MSKKLIGIIASFALVLSVGFATTASALTASDIAMLQAAGIINATQAASLSASIAPAPAMSSGYTFAKDLTVGSKGADVTALQTILVNGGYLKMPAGTAYGYFGAASKAALIKYQLAKGITPAAGYFGSKTRGMFNASSGSVTVTTGSTGSTVAVTGTDLKVSLAATSPMGGAIVNNQAGADMAEFTFTNTSATPAVVTNVTLARTGVSGDSTLANVYLYGGAVRLTDAATVSSGMITFNSASGLFTVPAGSSVVIAVKADIANKDIAAAGQTIVVSLTGVTSNVPVSAVYPVSGASFTVASAGDIATLTLGTVTNPVASNATINIQAGTLNQTIWSSALNISQRAVYLRSLALKVIGSIPTNSLQNIKLYVAGVQVATASGMDSNGMLTFDLTAAPYKMDSSRTLEVRADIVNGSTRQFSVSLQNAADLQVIDSNYNVGITASPIPASTGNIMITGGSVTVTQDSSLSSGNIVTGASNVALARYTMKAYGEDMKISYLNVVSSDQLDNVALYANGVQIGSTKTISATSTLISGSNDNLYNIGSSLIIPAGTSVTVEVRADIKYNGTNATTTNNFITVGIDGYTNNTQGSYSQQLSTVPGNGSTAIEISGPTFTVTGAGLSVGVNTAIANSTAIPNSTHVKLGSYILQTTSAEAVRVTSLTVGLGGAAGATTNVSNLYVSPAGATASTPINPQATNNFSVDFTIPANGSEIVDVYGDLGAVSTGVATTTLALSGYGVSSNISISQVAVNGQQLSVSAGALAIPTKNSTNSTASQLVLGGSSSQLLNLNFTSVNGASTINEMYFTATGSIVSVTVDGMSSQFSNGVASVTGLNHVVSVGSNGSVDLPISVTYSTVGDNGVTSNATSSIALTGYKYTSGNQSVSTTTLSVPGNMIGSNNMYVVGTKPTITLSKDPAQGSLTNGNVILGDITVAADAAGKLALNNIPLTIVGNNATVTAITVLTANGSTLSISGVGADATTSLTAINFVNSTNGAYKISAGQSVTFQVTGNVTGFSTNNGGTVSLGLGDASLFSWNDVAGSKTGAPVASSTMTAAHLYNYPVGTVSVSY